MPPPGHPVNLKETELEQDRDKEFLEQANHKDLPDLPQGMHLPEQAKETQAVENLKDPGKELQVPANPRGFRGKPLRKELPVKWRLPVQNQLPVMLHPERKQVRDKPAGEVKMLEWAQDPKEILCK